MKIKKPRSHTRGFFLPGISLTVFLYRSLVQSFPFFCSAARSDPFPISSFFPSPNFHAPKAPGHRSPQRPLPPPKLLTIAPRFPLSFSHHPAALAKSSRPAPCTLSAFSHALIFRLFCVPTARLCRAVSRHGPFFRRLFSLRFASGRLVHASVSRSLDWSMRSFRFRPIGQRARFAFARLVNALVSRPLDWSMRGRRAAGIFWHPPVSVV